MAHPDAGPSTMIDLSIECQVNSGEDKQLVRIIFTCYYISWKWV